jgi:hypothetical protein
VDSTITVVVDSAMKRSESVDSTSSSKFKHSEIGFVLKKSPMDGILDQIALESLEKVRKRDKKAYYEMLVNL